MDDEIEFSEIIDHAIKKYCSDDYVEKFLRAALIYERGIRNQNLIQKNIDAQYEIILNNIIKEMD